MRLSTVLWAMLAGLFLAYQLHMVLPGLAAFSCIIAGALLMSQMRRI